MPTHHRVGLDDQEVASPWLPAPRKPRPEAAVRGAEPRPVTAAPEHGELLPQGEVLQNQVLAFTPEQPQR